VGLKLNGTNLLLVYADDANLLGDNIDTIKKKLTTFIDVHREVLKMHVRHISTWEAMKMILGK
jgi:hypothetical protein